MSMATTDVPQAERIRLRRMVLLDAPAVSALSGELGYPTETARMIARLAAILDREDHAAFVATRGDAILGWGHAFVCQFVESDAFVEIGGLVVGEAARGQGVGSKLVEAIAGWARTQGVAEVRVRSNIKRGRAHAFYKSRGFVETKAQLVFARPLLQPAHDEASDGTA
ncbi:GNAT family N-acetyltransferase [Niveibacterium sp. COAC-50]|uniref:GNAT family N-acetyltransferase n=1 Tax=Niveibacterium sp. COAC-50 TaxID=2729384 RepID=UPI00155480E0|nr:GNAT family N-acetyltransferase [Niveibacterium sp. COAC-50]